LRKLKYFLEFPHGKLLPLQGKQEPGPGGVGQGSKLVEESNHLSIRIIG
jgi:hypothetical protein